MSKPSQRDLAVLYHCEQPTISRLKKAGVDIYNQDAVRAAILSQPNRPRAWVSGCPWDDKPEQSPAVDREQKAAEQIADLEKLAMQAADYNESRFIKTKIQSLRELLNLQIAEAEYVHKDEVEQDHIKIGYAIRSGLLRLANDLPPSLEGLNAAAMKKLIKEHCTQVLHLLGDEESELYPSEG